MASNSSPPAISPIKKSARSNKFAATSDSPVKKSMRLGKNRSLIKKQIVLEQRSQ